MEFPQRRLGMKAIQAILIALVAAIILTSAATANLGAAKQRVAIDMPDP